MNRLSLSAVAGSLVILASCSQEEVSVPTVPQGTGDIPISFRAGVSSRVNPDLDFTTNPSTFYVTGFANTHKASNGVLPDALFNDEPFYMMNANLYASTSNQKWPSPDEAKQMEFFAYAPSLDEIKSAAKTQLDPTASNYEALLGNYENGVKFYNQCIVGNTLDPMNQENTTFAGVQLYRGFKLARFYVATDISKQVDFITAHISAKTPETEDEAKIGVELNFKHQLANVELRAFSGNVAYNIEIAGVRLGRPYTGGAIFNFCDAQGSAENPEGGQWGISKDPQRLAVEYIYGEGDEIYRMGSFNNLTNGQIVTSPAHSTADNALSIMGKGGNAMVLPTKNGEWAGEANPWIAPKYSAQTGSENDPYPKQNPDPWSADNAKGDMYFSILLRVTLKPTGQELTTQQIYPYGNNTSMNVVYFEKEKNSNKIIGRVPSKTASIGSNNEVVEFGWAAVPVGVDWQRGKKYVYTLDYTNGVGVQDPEDPRPGAAIIGDGIKFSVSVVDWEEKNYSTPVPQE